MATLGIAVPAAGQTRQTYAEAPVDGVGPTPAPVYLGGLASDFSLLVALDEYVQSNPSDRGRVLTALREVRNRPPVIGGVPRGDVEAWIESAVRALERREGAVVDDRTWRVDGALSAAVLDTSERTIGTMVRGPGDLPGDVGQAGSSENNDRTWRWRDRFVAGPCDKSGCRVTDSIDFEFITDPGVNGVRVNFKVLNRVNMRRDDTEAYTYCNGVGSAGTCAGDIDWGGAGTGVRGRNYVRSMANKSGVVVVMKTTATDSRGNTRTSRARTGTASCGVDVCDY